MPVNAVPPAGVPGRPSPNRARPALLDWSRRSLAATRRALPDAPAATVHWAHRRWRDEAGTVLEALDRGVPVPRPETPVLVIAGGDDREVPPALSRSLAQWLGAGFVLAPGVSHVGALLGRQAANLARLAADWLSLQVR